VSHILAKDPLQVTATEDEYPVQALPPDSPHPALGEGVRPRGLDRSEDGGDALGGEDRIEALGELGVPITDQEPE
jgi:hypothetical protein